MCGIAGWADLKDDLSGMTKIMEMMAGLLANRGPDDQGFWMSTHVALAHRRLAIIDPAGGAQPMVRKRGDNTYIIVYNGELYNTLDLRRELEGRGYVFQSNCDTEVLLSTYMEWGEDCVERLNGIYAFGIWDEGKQRLFLARDRFGVKPLFYAQRGSSLIFASELKALLAHPKIKAEVDGDGLGEIFALGPARTPGHGVFKDIHEVKPAYCMIFDAKGPRQRKYWSLESHEHTDDFDKTSKTIQSLVKDAIERQLVADVPVCTFMSGGLDSSAISAIAANNFTSKGLERLHTYSIDYVDNDKFFKPSSFQPNPDAPWVARMAEHLGSDHHYVMIDTDQLVDALTGALKARDLPGMADVDSSLWLFCREVKKNATVALSGECADEVFGGYPWFHREELMNAGTFPWARDIEARTQILSPECRDLIKPEAYIESRYQETLAEVPTLPGEAPVDARRREIFYLNINWFMLSLLERKDRMSMAHGLEVRVPYCDHRLVQYVWNIPWEMKSWNGYSKGILRHALQGVLPDDVLFRSKSPYPKTHNPAYEAAVSKLILEVLNDSSSKILPFIDVNAIRAMAEGKSDYGKPFFGQLMATPQMFAYLFQVETWLREYKISII